MFIAGLVLHWTHIYMVYRYLTCSKTMPGSLGYEEKDAKTFAEWVRLCVF